MGTQIKEKKLSSIGLGCGSMTSSDPLKKAEGAATIHAALDAGIKMLNTADFYGSGQSEEVIGEALKSRNRNDIYLSVKFGALTDPAGRIYGLDVRPLTVKSYLAYTLKRLKLDYIDLYQPARIDTAIPVEETIGAISELVQAGYVRNIGLTQVDTDTLIKAHSVHPIHFVEMEYSLFNRSIETDLLETAKNLNIGVVAFGVLAHGLLSGAWSEEHRPSSSYVPLFFPENIDKNLSLVKKLNQIAAEKHVTLSQLAIAWVLHKGANITPLIGTSRAQHLTEALRAPEIMLTPEDMKQIEEAVPVGEIAGKSFPNMQFHNGVLSAR